MRLKFVATSLKAGYGKFTRFPQGTAFLKSPLLEGSGKTEINWVTSGAPEMCAEMESYSNKLFLPCSSSCSMCCVVPRLLGHFSFHLLNTNFCEIS